MGRKRVSVRLGGLGSVGLVAASLFLLPGPVTLAAAGMPYTLEEFKAAFLTNDDVLDVIGRTITLIPITADADLCRTMPAGGYSCAREWPIPPFTYGRPHSLIVRTFPDPAAAAAAFSAERAAAMAVPPMQSVITDTASDLSVQSAVDDLHYVVTSWRLDRNHLIEASCAARTSPGPPVRDVNTCSQILVNAQTPRLSNFVAPKIELPGPPTGVLSNIRGSNATVTWLAPESDGGGAITQFTATADKDGLTCSAAPSSLLIHTCTAQGAKAGVTYRFTVAATNSAGIGPASAPSTPSRFTTKPSAPRSAHAATSGTTSTIRWKRPAESGGLRIVRYEVTSSPGSLTCTTQGTSCSIDGLSYATKYRFAVRAINGRGASPAGVTPTITTALPPPPPPAPTPTPVAPPQPTPKPSQSLS